MAYDFGAALNAVHAGIDAVAEQNTARVIDAFRGHRVSDAHFSGTTGYGYNDAGRDTLDAVMAGVMGAESAVVRTQFVSGTHAIACALFGTLAPGRTLLSATGAPYDTLRGVIGKGHPGSLADMGVEYRELLLRGDGTPDLGGLSAAAARADVVFIQRSCGYEARPAVGIDALERMIGVIRAVNPRAVTLVDNCYCEFAETREPCMVGADLTAGSLIKNPGGGVAPAGGYIAGRADLVAAAAARLTAPGVGGECGATLGNNRLLYQGLFMAPHVTAQALKTVTFAAALLDAKGFGTSPRFDEPRADIIQTVRFGNPDLLLRFCRGIQAASPVDSFARPEPCRMPGYDCPVVMAAGTFIQGGSVELTCDAPMREPYTAFLQGGLTYEAGKYGVIKAVEAMEAP